MGPPVGLRGESRLRTLLISDLHSNIDALLALETQLAARGESCDQVVVLGDLVDYGPAPVEVIDWVRRHAQHVVRGNHDHAMATGAECKSSPAFKELSVVTREFFRQRLDTASMAFLRALPTRLSIALDGRTAWMVHATPRNPLFEYLRPDASDEVWAEALVDLAEGSDFGFLGHTHLPFVRPVGKTLVVNPGSLGQPKDGDPRGCYAVVDEGRVELRRVAYDVEQAVARLAALGLDERHTQALARVLRSGGTTGG